MTSELEDQEGGRVMLILISIGAGFIAWHIAHDFTNNSLLMLSSGIITSILYSLTGAIVVLFCDNLKNWSDPKEKTEWSTTQKLLLGAIFPVTLLFSLTIYVFLGVINRAYE